MEQSQALQPETVIPPHILDGQRLAANEHYPEHVFSMEFDVLLLEEIHRSKIHRTCYAHQLQSFDILRDNLLGTKRLRLTEFSILHGRHLKHQDFPTSLHLQHRFVQLLQKYEHSSRWAPRSQEISRLLLQRNKFVRMLKDQAKNSNVKVAFFKPTVHYTKAVSDSSSPTAVNWARFRARNAPKVGRRPLKDKSFCLSLPTGFKHSTTKKSLPRRKARKGDSYEEQVIADLDFPTREPYELPESSPQRLPTKKSTPINLVPRKPDSGATSSNQSPMPAQAATPNRPGINPAYLNNLTPVKVSGLSKTSLQKHPKHIGKDFPMGRRAGVFRDPVKFSRLSTFQSSAKTPIDVDNFDDTTPVVAAQAVTAEARSVSPSGPCHSIDLNGNEIAARIVSMEESLRRLKETIENKITTIEMRMSNIEQALPIEMVGKGSGMRKDMQNVRLEIGQMASSQSKKWSELMNLTSSMHKQKSSKEKEGKEGSVDKTHIEKSHSDEAQESSEPRQGMDPCHDAIEQSEHNTPMLKMNPIETKEANDECLGNTSDTLQPEGATDRDKLRADLEQEEGRPSMLSTFATRLQESFSLSENLYRRVLGDALKHRK
ncbi:hypothetical protein FGB62_58g044 [Gracilaria domingensis]|nr:hypothetical protein FGB62_58g044 [Gracilaria domingensis]